MKKRQRMEQMKSECFTDEGFCMELMEGFEETGEDMAGSVFLSGYRPEKLLICPGKHAGFTFQTLSTEEISENEHMEISEKISGVS